MTAPHDSQAAGPVHWARTVNRRWIVHHGLKESAEAFLNHLDRVDTVRLSRACRRARQLVDRAGPAEDPKPWFYAGLFSLATVEEAKRFLSGHWFTAACMPASREATQAPTDIAPETQAKLERIQNALLRLEEEE